MRDDHKQDLKKTKQRIREFCLSQGYHYDGGKWTQAHFKWLKALELSELDRETLGEYLITYEYQTNRIEGFDKRIEELASETEYVEKVKKLVCFLGVKTHTALSCLVETGDFKRFAKGNIYAAYLGLVPGEDSIKQNALILCFVFFKSCLWSSLIRRYTLTSSSLSVGMCTAS